MPLIMYLSINTGYNVEHYTYIVNLRATEVVLCIIVVLLKRTDDLNHLNIE
jgi:hypothetical protein